MDKEKRALMSRFMEKPISGGDIEKLSFEIIDREAPAHTFSADEWQVVRRMIHTTGDFAVMDDVRFSSDAIASAIEALNNGKPVYTDTNMIRSGISMAKLTSLNSDYNSGSINCHIADSDIAAEAKQSGLPRSLLSVRKAANMLDGAIVLFGNAPVGLMELNRMIIEEGIKPALVVAVPVGFVHVAESKDELMGLDVPFIALKGRRGGSAIAVSILHALISLAAQKAGSNKKNAVLENPRKAVILMGHGSRMPGADSGMEQVTRSIREKYKDFMIETCSMSLLGPRFGEIFEQCVAKGAQKVIVIPYFLHFGAHMQEDIPEILIEKAGLFPDVKLIMGKHLGFDEKLTELVVKRIAESEGLEDIRTVHSSKDK
ncbi:MAG: precorrin-8X methylmutase [Smithella sp.]